MPERILTHLDLFSGIPSAASQSPPRTQDSPQSHSLKSNLMPAKYSNDTGPTCPTSGTSKTSPRKLWPTPSICGNYNRKGASKTSGDGLETAVKKPETIPDDSSSSQVDFLASLSARPGDGEARKITARSGLKCSELLQNADPCGCLVKMCLESSQWNSTVCFLTWKISATPRGRLLFQLAPSMPDTDETECGLWPTPRAMPGNYSMVNGKRYETSLQSMARRGLLPTPRCADGTKGIRTAEGTAKERLRRKNGQDLPTIAGGSLNPQFVEFLMNYPKNWTKLVLTPEPASANVVHGSSDKTRPVETLPGLRQQTVKETIPGNARKHERVLEAEVLRHSVHGQSLYDACTEPFRNPKKTKTISEIILRALQNFRETRHPSQGQELEKQCALEFDDAVFILSHIFASRSGRHREETYQAALFGLRQTIRQTRVVQYSSDTAEATWQSLPEEDKDWEIVATCLRSTNWSEWPDTGRVCGNIPNRSHRLRGLGNAIVPAVAEVILRNIALLTQ